MTDCGTSRSGVVVFVALVMTGTRYPSGALTVTFSRRPATGSMIRDEAVSSRPRTMVVVVGEKPGAMTTTE